MSRLKKQTISEAVKPNGFKMPDFADRFSGRHLQVKLNGKIIKDRIYKDRI